MNELALFAGAGGGILGGKLLGWRTICAVEFEPSAAGVLLQRQNDGILPPFPIWDDVRTFDGKPWRGVVDVVSGGFPCQDVSVCGNGSGLDGERSGLWVEMGRIVGEIRPRFVFVENSPALTSRGLGRVVGDLARMGYGCRWGIIGADFVGASNRRKRFWLVAYPYGTRLESVDFPQPICFDSQEPRGRQLARAIDASIQADDYARDRGNYVDVAGTMDRLKAIGNGQNPFVAAKAFRLLARV